MIIKRDLIQSIKPFLVRKEFISIIGPRQSGKTTFLEILKTYLIKEVKVCKDLIKIITFEDRKLLMQFERDPVSFVRSYAIGGINEQRFYLMIDEFQYAHEGGQKLKLIYDTVKDIKIFITGSSSLEIKAKVGKFMVGRILNFYLYPFNFREYLRSKDARLERIYSQHNAQSVRLVLEARDIEIESKPDVFYEEFNKEYEMFSIWGGYPAIVLSRGKEERTKLIGDIYNNYILKDIKTLLELSTENNLFLLSQYLAAQIGNIVVYQNLSQNSGLIYRKLIKHLNILEETFVCKTVRPFFKNRQKELSKNPKIFFMDMGFRNNLMENMNSLSKRPDTGAIIENAVFIRLNELCSGIEKINFWRTKAGAEVDFILHVKGNIIPVEVKYSNFTCEKLSKSLMSFIDTFAPKHTLVLTKNYWGFTKRKKTKVFFIPLYYL